MDIFHSILLGIIEGFTEFLPISSTAHLIVAEKLLGLQDSEFLKSFTVIIQFGAMLAVLALYGKRLMRDRETNKRILIAFIPTAVIGLLLHQTLKHFLLGNAALSLWVLGMGGVVLIVFERMHARERETIDDLRTMPYKKAFLIGCAQALAIVPGVSRSAATILAGLGVGVTRAAAVEFSFLLAFPTILAAAGYDFVKSYGSFDSSNITALGVGFMVSFLFGIVSIHFLTRVMQKSSLAPFGWYRVFASAILLFTA